MTSRNRLFAVVTLPISAAILVAGAWLASAGDLNPPAGPITSTMKTLVEVEPRTAVNATNTPGDANSVFRITSPGSYYLAANQSVGVAGKTGIEIASGDVTIDLMGFRLSAGIAGTLDGITMSGNFNNITIRNGTVTGFGGNGVKLFASTATGGLIEGVHTSANGLAGIMSGLSMIVRDCSAVGNLGPGFNLLSDSLAIHCSANGNGSTGFVSGAPGASVIECAARSNAGDGIEVGTGGVAERCLSMQNTGDGIQCTFNCIVRDNSCWSNGLSAGDGAGIHALFSDNRIEGNNCTSADRGIDVDAAGNIIIKNTCAGNTIDWVIVANNVFGPIIDRRAPASAAVSGFSAASSLGSTDANANFSY